MVDLHIHTNASDGEYLPEEIIRKAKTENIETIAITDHDSVFGLKTLNEKSEIERNGIEVIDGIELSALSINQPKKLGEQFHILGLDIDPYNKALTERTEGLKQKSIEVILKLIFQLKEDFALGFNDKDIEDLIKLNRILGRPDIAKLCINYGYVKTVKEAFDRYLVPSYTKLQNVGLGKGIPYLECLELITNSGGIPVLAHPKSLMLGEIEFLKLLRNMIDNGLRGIEVYHSSHTKEEMDYYKKIALEYGLLISGGSDYHGPQVKPDIELGRGKNNNLCLRKEDLTVLTEFRKGRK